MPRILLLIATLAITAPTPAAWLPEERLTERTGQTDRTCFNNARAGAFDPAGNLHVVWHGTSADRLQVWYSRRDTETGQWSPNEVISTDETGAWYAALATDAPGRVHVVWCTRDSLAVRYRRRETSGTWGPVETVRTGPRIETPSIAIGRADSVFVAWSEETLHNTFDIYIAARGEANWGTAELLSGMLSGRFCLRPSVAADDRGALAVAWLDRGTHPPYIHFRAREGGSWLPIETIYADDRCDTPSLAVSDGGVFHCVWRRELPGGFVPRALAYRQRRDGLWGNASLLPDSSRHIQPGSIVVDDAGILHVAYFSDSAGTNPQLYYTRADSLGRNWTQPERLTDASGTRAYPTLCLSPFEDLAVIWTDYRHNQANPDIYCRLYELGLDVAAGRLITPEPQEDSGAVVVPSFRVRNTGRDTAFSIQATIRFSGYSDTATIAHINPRDSASVSFQPVTLMLRGSQAYTCSVYMAGDENPANNVRRGEFFVRVIDAAVDSVVAVPNLVRVRDTVRLRAALYNPGNVAVQGWCHFEIADSVAPLVRDSLPFELAAGARTELSRSYVPDSETRYLCRVAVTVAGDVNPENDTASTTFQAFIPRLEVTALPVPGPKTDSGFPVRPTAELRNLSPGPVGVIARFRTEDGYSADVQADSLQPGQTRVVEFAEWRPTRRDSLGLSCSVFVKPDSMFGAVRYDWTFVRVLDARADSIISPRGIFSVRDTLYPVIAVSNPGNDSADFLVRFIITDSLGGIAYEDSAEALGLPPGSGRPVGLREWSGPAGEYRAIGRVVMNRDMNPENDTASAEFSLVTGELLLTAIIAPEAQTDSGAALTPAVTVRNVGLQPVRFQAFFGIADGYIDSVLVPALSPRQDTLLRFAPWLPLTRGEQAVACSLLVLPDSTLVGPLTGHTFVRVIDATARAIVEPRGSIPPGPLTPVVRFANKGNVPGLAVCRLRFSGYDDSVLVQLPAGQDTLVRFAEWDAQPGRFELVASISLPGDMHPENDTCRAELTVDTAATRAWQRLADLPDGIPPRPVRRGGRLVATAQGLFGLRATSTSECFHYLAANDDWQPVAPVPDERAVREGAAACAGPGDSLFLFPGRSRRNFLLYCPNTDRWNQLESLPYGLRPVRYGTGMTYLAGDTGRVFLATGSGRFGFLVYLVGPDRWHARRPVPAGPRNRGCRYGTGLVTAGDRVFLLKGGTSEFYEYFPATDSWATRADLPSAPGRRQKTGRGAALAADRAHRIYALSGRGNEFWSYDPETDSWHRQEDAPLGEHRSRVGRGAALAAYERNIYLLKGGGSNEFWRYNPDAATRPAPKRSGIMAETPLRTDPPEAMPVVVRGILHLPVSPPALPLYPHKLIASDGRRVMELRPGENDIRHLAPGVYYLRAGRDRPQNLKLVILR